MKSDTPVPTGAAAVGQMLREAREALGRDLVQVAEETRIRQHLLEAMEEGRFGDLPGSAYAPAFLRGYAACVGLDADRVLQVWRSADKPVAPVSAHHFPVIAPARGAPRGAMMLASAVLLVCAYATWHALTRDQMTQDVRVPPVPQRLLADQKPATSTGAPQVATQAPAATATVAPPAPSAPPEAATATAPSVPAPATAPLPAPPPVTASVPATPSASPNVPSTTIVPPAATANPPAAAATLAPTPADRSDGRPVNPPAPERTAGIDAKPETGNPQSPTATPAGGSQSPQKPDGNTATARAPTPGPTTAGSLTVQDTDPTQGNRVVSRPAPPPRPAPKPAPLPSTAGADVAPPPPQQATLPAPEATPPAVKPRTVSAPVSTQQRIVRAEVDSTLELRGPRGEVLATTHLSAGTTYTVPEHVGYVLTPVQR